MGNLFKNTAQKSSSSSTPQVPAWLANSLYANSQDANALAARPFDPYTGDFTAGTNDAQMAGMGMVAGLGNYQAQQIAPGAIAGGDLFARGAGQSLGGTDLSGYMNPYVGSVVDTTMAQIDRSTAQQLQQNKGQAALSGAFGGDRAALVDVETNRNADQLKANTSAQLYDQAFRNAQGAAQYDITNRNQLAAQQAGFDQQAQTTNLSAYMQAMLANQGADLSAAQLRSGVGQTLYGMGTQQQQTEQHDLDAQYQEFMRAINDPYQKLQFAAGINNSLSPAFIGQTTNTRAQGPAPLMALAGLGISALGAYGSAGGFKADGGRVGYADGGRMFDAEWEEIPGGGGEEQPGNPELAAALELLSPQDPRQDRGFGPPSAFPAETSMGKPFAEGGPVFGGGRGNLASTPYPTASRGGLGAAAPISIGPARSFSRQGLRDAQPAAPAETAQPMGPAALLEIPLGNYDGGNARGGLVRRAVGGDLPPEDERERVLAQSRGMGGLGPALALAPPLAPPADPMPAPASSPAPSAGLAPEAPAAGPGPASPQEPRWSAPPPAGSEMQAFRGWFDGEREKIASLSDAKLRTQKTVQLYELYNAMLETAPGAGDRLTYPQVVAQERARRGSATLPAPGSAPTRSGAVSPAPAGGLGTADEVRPAPSGGEAPVASAAPHPGLGLPPGTEPGAASPADDRQALWLAMMATGAGMMSARGPGFSGMGDGLQAGIQTYAGLRGQEALRADRAEDRRVRSYGYGVQAETARQNRAQQLQLQLLGLEQKQQDAQLNRDQRMEIARMADATRLEIAQLLSTSRERVAATPRPGADPELVRLQTARDALPEGDPRRAELDARIGKLSAPALGGGASSADERRDARYRELVQAEQSRGLSADEQLELDVLKRRLEAPRTTVGPDGAVNTITPPPMPLPRSGAPQPAAEPRPGTSSTPVPGGGQVTRQPSTELGEKARGSFASDLTAYRGIDDALEAVMGRPNSAGLWTGAVPDVARQYLDLDGTKTRALIARISATEVHDMTGAAQSIAEVERLKPYIPLITDRPEAIIEKLRLMKREMRQMMRDRAAMYPNATLPDPVRTAIDEDAPAAGRASGSVPPPPPGFTLVTPKTGR
jgi:hypothetical protein